jgi:uncharacterized damage-inducible protein DinB
MNNSLNDLVAAHDELMPLFKSISEEALDWRPREDEFSVKHILVHLTHANDFYLMILEEARAVNFDVVRIHSELPGWKRMVATDAEAWQCQNVVSLHVCFEQAFQHLLTALADVSDEEFERPFVLYEAGAEAEPRTVTLQERVLDSAASHLREHLSQLSETLVQWRSAQSTL